MTLPDPLLEFWLALSALSPDFERTSWGTVIADPRYPMIWDANHAGIFEHHDRVSAEEIRAAVHQALRRAGAVFEHAEFWDPPEQCPALDDLRTGAERHAADVVMVHQAPATLEPPGEVTIRRVVNPDAEFWRRYSESRNMFGEPLPPDVVDQMDRRDREVMIPAGLRLFAASVNGELAGLANLLSLDGVGYVDNVVTFPEFRRRGVATALIMRLVDESLGGGDRAIHLLADEGQPPQRLYERLGFRVWARVASCTRRLARPEAG
jgi:GNAT superfamily N-acetyltransferase